MKNFPSTCWYRRLVAPAALALALAAGSGKPLEVNAQSQALPEIGDPSGSVITPADEQRLGQAFMRSIRGSMKVVDDPVMTAYIQRLGNQLVENSDGRGSKFHFFLVDDPKVNAFAGPAGYIGVYTGLILASQSESELASVISHEIAHVTQRHLVRTFDAVNRLNLPATALAIAALVIGAASNNPDAGIAAATGLQAGMIQAQINFTRAHEQEADRIGIGTLAAAGFDPAAMPVFFSRMGKANQLYDSGKLPEFLQTHPVTSKRIAESFDRAGAFPYRQHQDSLEYSLLRARLRQAKFDDSAEAVAFFQNTLEEGRYRNREAQSYGYLMALMANRQYDDAGNELKKLLQAHPQQVDYRIAEARLADLRKQPQRSLTILADALRESPGNYPLTLFYAQALLDHGKPAQALQLLEPQLQGHDQDVRLYKLLARGAGESGKKSLGHAYLAEYYYSSGQPESAMQQLQIALRDRDMDYYLNARISARLKEIREEVTELRKREQ